MGFKGYYMKYLFIITIIIFMFTGCSKKCMNNKHACTPAEEFMGNVIKGAANTAEFINNHTKFMKYNK